MNRGGGVGAQTASTMSIQIESRTKSLKPPPPPSSPPAMCSSAAGRSATTSSGARSRRWSPATTTSGRFGCLHVRQGSTRSSRSTSQYAGSCLELEGSRLRLRISALHGNSAKVLRCGRFLYACFPINASITSKNSGFEIRNYLGEMKARKDQPLHHLEAASSR